MPDALPAVSAAQDIDKLLRKLTPTQRRVLKALPEHKYQFWGALVACGVSKHTGHRWMRMPDFAAVRDLMLKQEIAEVSATPGRVLRELAHVAFSDTRKLFAEDGRLKAPHEMDDETAASISGIEVEELFEGRGAEREHVGTLRKVKRWDKVRALETLAKYNQMLGVDNGAGQTPVGPGLTVIVQTAGGTTAVQAGPGAQGSVVVNLPGPER